MKKEEKNILWFGEVDKDDIGLVGGKGANLGEMASFDVPINPGFIITSGAYFDFIEQNKFKTKIKESLKELDITDPQQINVASQKIKNLIISGKISEGLAKEIINNYLKLGGILSQALVAVRSSATAEDLPGASFAGQHETFLNVRGEANVVNRVKECWASLFEPRAIFYRQEKNFEHFKVGMAVIIQEMLTVDISGVTFTIDPVTNEKNTIIIEAVYGLGELIVQGTVTPDRYVVEKSSLDILKREVSKQTIQLAKVGTLNRKIRVPKKLQSKRKLTDKQIVELAKIGKKIHNHYFFPQDIEWILSKNKFYLVQTRAVTTIQKVKMSKKDEKPTRKPFLKGQAASPGITSGPVRIVKSAKEIKIVESGDILVTAMTSPDFVPAMKKAAAIVTDKGGQTSHAAIVSRELGVPCIVGTEKATKKFKNGQIITVNGTTGEIFRGGVALGKKTIIQEKNKKPTALIGNLPESVKTATKVYVNLAEPELAEVVAQRNVDGVGLLRAEFMIADIGTHPKKLIKEGQAKLFIDKLSEGIGKFCQAFHPRPVVYRATDFKTNEYRHLAGGQAFEPEEENPFLGYRGAFRYLSDPAVFQLELKAIKRVRRQFNNLWLMIPFVRTPKELQETKKLIAAEKLMRSSTFKLWVMVEIPSNVILLEDFIKVGIDGVSIGSNDLTMLILGVDRDNAELASVFNEQDPAVLWALEKVIKTCQKNKITSSICGQAPSVYPELVENLVRWGITSVSINPDAIERTRELVYDVERRLAKK